MFGKLCIIHIHMQYIRTYVRSHTSDIVYRLPCQANEDNLFGFIKRGYFETCHFNKTNAENAYDFRVHLCTRSLHEFIFLSRDTVVSRQFLPPVLPIIPTLFENMRVDKAFDIIDNTTTIIVQQILHQKYNLTNYFIPLILKFTKLMQSVILTVYSFE